jgi:uncharacterized membrane protein YoaT (DUF817 family)
VACYAHCVRFVVGLLLALTGIFFGLIFVDLFITKLTSEQFIPYASTLAAATISTSCFLLARQQLRTARRGQAS